MNKTMIRTVDCHSDSINFVTFSPDGQLLASASDDGLVGLYDSAKGTVRQTLNCHSGSVNYVTFSPNGKLLAVLVSDDKTDDEKVQLWDITHETVLQEFKGQAVALSVDGTVQALDSVDGNVKLYGGVNKTLYRDEKLTTLRHKKAPYRMLDGYPKVAVLAFSPESSLLACGYDDGVLKFWDVSAEDTTSPQIYDHSDAITCLAFSQDGKMIASASHDRTIRLWDISQAADRKSHKLGDSPIPVSCLAFSPDSKLLASAFDRKIRAWDVANRELLHESEASGTVSALSISSYSVRACVIVNHAQSHYINIYEITL